MRIFKYEFSVRTLDQIERDAASQVIWKNIFRASSDAMFYIPLDINELQAAMDNGKAEKRQAMQSIIALQSAKSAARDIIYGSIYAPLRLEKDLEEINVELLEKHTSSKGKWIDPVITALQGFIGKKLADYVPTKILHL